MTQPPHSTATTVTNHKQYGKENEEIIYDPIQTWSGLPKPSTGEDGYFSQTLSTPITIPACRTLRRRFSLASLPSSLPSLPPPWPSPTADPSLPPAVDPADLIMILDLAAPGVCGHPSTAHGGVLATVIDECMSLAVLLYIQPHSEQKPETPPFLMDGEGEVSPHAGKMFTAQLDIRYKMPVAVPGMVEVHARVLARKGRKFWVTAQVRQRGEVKTDAMAFWLLTRASL